MSSPIFPQKAFQFLVALPFIIVAGAAGCRETGKHANHLPAPLRDDFPYELKFQSARVWEPECLEVNLNGVMHRIVLASVEPPPPNNSQRPIAIETLRDLVGMADGRAVVQGRDRFQREIAQVFISPRSEQTEPRPLTARVPEIGQPSEVDVGLRLIELGLAKHNWTQWEHGDDYRRAEAAARAGKRGLWKAD
jgi:endonuclease YncB( thermonuclease family)